MTIDLSESFMEEPTQAWKFIQTITPALIGFAGVFLGVAVSVLREYISGRHKRRADSAYLAAIVGGALETFISECSDVVGDDGQVDIEGYNNPRTSHPRFNALSFDVEWTSLPPDLLFDIQDVSYQVHAAEAAIASASEYAATPPDYEEFFEERQYQFARLGLHCAAIVERLRRHSKLSPRPKVYQWDPNLYFQKKINEVEARRAQPQIWPALDSKHEQPQGNGS